MHTYKSTTRKDQIMAKPIRMYPGFKPGTPMRIILEIELGRKYGSTIGWIANVINAQGFTNPTKKIRGLAILARDNRVSSGIDIDTVSIDGSIVPMSELEKYAEGYQTPPDIQAEQLAERVAV
jgi:hypothetical protein